MYIGWFLNHPLLLFKNFGFLSSLEMNKHALVAKMCLHYDLIYFFDTVNDYGQSEISL
jgi:hypothetical protein